jgi:hypothetical protein
VIQRARRQRETAEEREALRQRIMAATRTPEVRRRRSVMVTESRLGWCPPPFRADYRRMVDLKRFTAAEARALIEPQIERWLQTFEGKLWRVATGRATVREQVAISRPVSTPFSLTGGSL